MNVRIAKPQEIEKLSKLSTSRGNIPFVRGQAIISLAEDKGEIVGFAAVQNALHAAGSWVKEDYRRKKLTYEMRAALDNELRAQGFSVYFAFPATDFERHLFAKYGQVIEHLAQIRHL